MRVFAAFLVLATITTGAAEASSFAVLEPMKESLGPSMIMLGGPAPDQTAAAGATAAPEKPATALPGRVWFPPDFVVLSPSIIAWGEPASNLAPSIAYENVAAIPPAEENKPSQSAPLPMVIRGGLVDDAFESSVSAGPPQAIAEPPILDPDDTGTPAKRKALKRQRERMEQEQAAAPEPEPSIQDPSTPVEE